ncbi:uncharacterized protein LOC121111196 isoform X1 [Gallus gallus]|uniref:uncharacterized protein LOC121111196 isoform X1 n=2 Tax=Gallus gallus TaxID=9031 RepID=UPI001AE10B39|nr:uncharacterized protein LOC121111196 isoform X1 [Gallus gallus]
MPHGHGLAAVPMPALVAVARAARGTPGVPKHSRKGARVSSHAQWRTGIGFYPCHAHSRAPHTHLPSVARAAEAMAEKYSSEMLAVDNAESGALLEELMECKKRSAELAAVLREQTKIRQALKEEVEMEMKNLQKAQRRAQKRTAPRRKTARREEHMSSLLQETVAVRLDEQTAAQKHPLVTSWLRRFLLFLGLLQLVFFTLVVLQKDILRWVLPAELAPALGIRPPTPALF